MAAAAPLTARCCRCRRGGELQQHRKERHRFVSLLISWNRYKLNLSHWKNKVKISARFLDRKYDYLHFCLRLINFIFLNLLLGKFPDAVNFWLGEANAITSSKI